MVLKSHNFKTDQTTQSRAKIAHGFTHIRLRAVLLNEWRWIGQSNLGRLDAARKFSAGHFKRVADALDDQRFKQQPGVNSGNRKVVAYAAVVLGGWIVRGLLVMVALINMVVRNIILRQITGECFMFMIGVAVVHAGDMIVPGVIDMPNGMQ